MQAFLQLRELGDVDATHGAGVGRCLCVGVVYIYLGRSASRCGRVVYILGFRMYVWVYLYMVLLLLFGC